MYCSEVEIHKIQRTGEFLVIINEEDVVWEDGFRKVYPTKTVLLDEIKYDRVDEIPVELQRKVCGSCLIEALKTGRLKLINNRKI